MTTTTSKYDNLFAQLLTHPEKTLQLDASNSRDIVRLVSRLRTGLARCLERYMQSLKVVGEKSDLQLQIATTTAHPQSSRTVTKLITVRLLTPEALETEAFDEFTIIPTPSELPSD